MKIEIAKINNRTIVVRLWNNKINDDNKIKNIILEKFFFSKYLLKIIKLQIKINNNVLDEPVDLGLTFPKKVSLEKKNVYKVFELWEIKKFTKVL